MANINISELSPTGCEFFQGSETYLSELNDLDNDELAFIYGGATPSLIAIGKTIAASSKVCGGAIISATAALSGVFLGEQLAQQ